jgi:D-glycero-D-manno-heptose 1,7-bisphosphate phosphatase
MTDGARPALFLDRDGVVNYDDGFVHRIADCRFVDGIFALVAAFAARGFAVVIATNQSGIGRGLFSEAEFQELMREIKREFVRNGAGIDAVYHCPDHPTEGQGRYRRDSDWRKPKPGMLLQAAHDLGLDLSRSWLVGDKERDLAAGRAAGVGSLVLFDENASRTERHGDHGIVRRLAEIAGLLAGGRVNESLRVRADDGALGFEDAPSPHGHHSGNKAPRRG